MNNISNRSEDDFVTLYKTKTLEFRIYDRFTDEYCTLLEYPYNRRTYHLMKLYKLINTHLKAFSAIMLI